MTKRQFLASLFSLTVLAGNLLAGEGVVSGPQVGKDVPGPFHPLNINGEHANEKFCLYCVNGSNPVAMVFAREVNPTVTALIKKIDAANVKNADKSMGSFFVFLGESDDLTGKLKEVATKSKLKKTVLSVDNPAGPEGYNVAKDADVTVVLYTDRVVKANHSFKKGELNAKAIDKIVADISKILPN